MSLNITCRRKMQPQVSTFFRPCQLQSYWRIRHHELCRENSPLSWSTCCRKSFQPTLNLQKLRKESPTSAWTEIQTAPSLIIVLHKEERGGWGRGFQHAQKQALCIFSYRVHPHVVLHSLTAGKVTHLWHRVNKQSTQFSVPCLLLTHILQHI